MNDSDNNSIPAGCSTALKGCTIVIVLVMALFIAGMVYFMRLPSIHAMQICASNIQEVGAAISRYEDVNDRRPSDLRELEKQYLPKPSVLRCPLDTTPGDEPSYTYNPRAKNRQVMLECDRHALKQDMPKSKLRVLGDGTYQAINPSIREAVKEAEKQSKSQR